MSNNGKRKLVNEGEDKQVTEQGLEIPIPTKPEFMDVLNRATRKRGKPSRSSKGKRRTSRDDQ